MGIFFNLLFGSNDAEKEKDKKKSTQYDEDELDWELDDMEYFESHR